jgi:hypothetical protein
MRELAEVGIGYNIPFAKALIGAALIQYLIYAVFYIIEGFKLEEFDKEEQVKPQSHPA